MKNASEHKQEKTSEEQFDTSSGSRAGWILIGGFALIIALLVAVEVFRRIG
jgi:hypothetical protein